MAMDLGAGGDGRTEDRAGAAAPAEADHLRHVVAQDAVLLGRGQEVAVAADIVERLLVGAEALDIRHVGAPDELPGAETIAHATDQLLRLRVGIVPDAAPGNREHHFEEQIVAAIGALDLLGKSGAGLA
jgi:hypothetical protein